mmetsp:Transcript_16510/g.28622  ORF Transcript_16510/g.28622 Transcript_16510/m.28622 type:complete len:439 (+) Transcript_16510:62-1378(+)
MSEMSEGRAPMAYYQSILGPNGPQLPTAWSSKEKYSMLDLSESNLRVTYTGQGKSDAEAAAVRANHPIPVSCGIYYFETKVVNKGRDGFIGVGFCAGDVSLNRLPGWERNSYGYHGDDGNSFRGSGSGAPYGPTFSTGDVVGCCVNLITNTIFYTKNGINLGIAFRDVKGPLYPTVGLRTPGEVVDVNFGDQPFKFDLDALLREEKERIRQWIEAVELKGKEAQLSSLVLSYLLHHGYSDTAAIFARDAHALSPDVLTQLQHSRARQRICSHVIEGEIDAAMELARELFAALFVEPSYIVFLLKCQKFVELVKTASITDALMFGRAHLAIYESHGPQYTRTLEEIFSLLAYTEPHKSPVAYLLDSRRRQPVAAALNSAILGFQGNASQHALERLAQQTAVVFEQLHVNQLPIAAFAQITDFLDPSTSDSPVSLPHRHL